MSRRFASDFLRGSAFTAVGAAISAVFQMAAIVMVARNTTNRDVGIYLLVITVANVLSVFAGLGLDLTLAKYVADHSPEGLARTGPESSKSGDSVEPSVFVMPAVIMRIAALIVVALIAVMGRPVIVRLFGEDVGALLPYVTVLFFITSFRDMFFCVLQGLRRFRRYASAQVSSSLVRIGLLGLLIGVAHVTPARLVQTEIAVALFSFGLLLVSLHRELSWKIKERRIYSQLLHFSLPLYLNNLLTVSYDRIGMLMVGGLLTPISIAYYGVAEKIPEGFFRIFRSFITVYFPNLSRLLAGGKKEEAREVMNHTVQLVSAAVLGLVLTIFLFQNELVSILFTAQYLPAAWACSLLTLGVYLRLVANIMGYSLVSAGYSSVPVKANSVCFTVNVVSNMVMIPLFGFMGAVYSLLIMNSLAQAIYYRYLKKAGLALRMRSLLPMLLVALTMGGYYWLGEKTPVAKIAFILLYAGLCFWLIDDLRQLAGMTWTKARRYLPVRTAIKTAEPDCLLGGLPGQSLRVLMVDSAVGNEYAVSLCSALRLADVDVSLATTRDRIINPPPAFPVKRWAPSKNGGWKLLKAADYWLYLWRIARYALSRRTDLLHYQFFRRERTESLCLWFLRLMGARIVYTCHNVLPHENIRLDDFLKRIVCRSSEIIIAHSHHLKQTLMDRFHVPSNKIWVIPHGNFDVHVPAHGPSRAEARRELGLDDADDVLLFFGYIRKYKGLDLLVDAFEGLLDRQPRLKLLIAGSTLDGAMQAWCNSRLAGFPAGGRLLFHSDYISPERVPFYFIASDLVALPYRQIYHSGIIHLAYSFGRPVIATRVGDFEETVIEGKTGFLCDANTTEALAEKIVEAMSDKEKLEQMGIEARQLSEREYSWNNIALRTKEAYSSLLAANPAAG